MTLLLLLLSIAWFWAIFSFARWRWISLEKEQGKHANVLNDWAVQLMMKGTGLLLLVLLVLAAKLCG